MFVYRARHWITMKTDKECNRNLKPSQCASCTMCSEKQLYYGSTGIKQMDFAVFINIGAWLIKRNLKG